MPVRKAQDCADLSQVRIEIDRIDNDLVDRIAERFGYVERAWQIKLGLKQEASVPWRNQQVIDKVRARAVEKGVPPDLCEASPVRKARDRHRGSLTWTGAGRPGPSPLKTTHPYETTLECNETGHMHGKSGSYVLGFVTLMFHSLRLRNVRCELVTKSV